MKPRAFGETVKEPVPEHDGHAARRPTSRRGIVRVACVACLALAPAPVPAAAPPQPVPPRWKAGPCLLLDDFLLAQSEHLARKVTPPARHPAPVVTGAGSDGRGDRCFQPYLTVIRDPLTRRFRIWYSVPESEGQSHVATMESEDGVKWIRPHRVLADPARITFGCAIVDRGPEFPRGEERFALGFFGTHRGRGGLQIAVSPDGLRWNGLDVVLPTSHDIVWLGWDPLRRRYLAFVSMIERGWCRTPYQSVSDDLRSWKEPWRVAKPEPGEEGETQFYCMAGAMARGDLLVALVKVLRDDLNAEPGVTAKDLGDTQRAFAGIGYTGVAWSRDGETWTRDIEPFLDRNAEPGTWDRAMAWGDCQLVVDDETFVYYGGYRRGHKVERFTERQIGLARMPRDRYVARVAGPTPGKLRTRAAVLDATGLALNARVKGAIKARILDAEGRPVEGYDWTDGRPIRGDGVRLEVTWRRPLVELKGKAVALELSITDAELWAFEWTDG